MKHFNLFSNGSTTHVLSGKRVIHNVPALRGKDRKGLRLLILCLSLATLGVESAWGAWSGSGQGTNIDGTYYVLNYSSEIALSLGDESSDLALSGPGKTVSFQAHRTKAGINSGFYMQVYNQATEEWDDKYYEINCGTSYENKNTDISTDISKLCFASHSPGSLKKYVKNIRVTMAQYIDAPSATSLDCGTALLGSGNTSNTFTVAWCNVPAMSWSISGADASQFSVSANVNAEAGKYNTTTFTVTYKHDKIGKHSATLTIKDTYGNYSKTVSLSGSTTAIYRGIAKAYSPSTKGYVFVTVGSTTPDFTRDSYDESLYNSSAVAAPPTATGTYYAEPKTGYLFSGWFKDVSYQQVAEAADLTNHNKIAPTFTVTSIDESNRTELSRYAKFNPITYTIAFNGNGATGGSTASVSATYDQNATLTSNGFSRTGYTFAGWNTNADGSGTSYGNSATVKNLTSTNGATVTLYAQWTANNYHLHLDFNGGTKGTATTYDNTLTYNTSNYNDVSWTVPTREGYTFKGFFDANGVQAYDAEGHSVNSKYWSNKNYIFDGDLTASAKWQVHTYSVQYNGNGNTSGSMSNQGFTYDQAQNLTANSFKKEYTVTYDANSGSVTPTSETSTASFQGWATSAGGTKVYSDNQSVSNLASTQGATVNLYAVWSNTPSVTLPTPTRTGCIFNGWYTEATGGTKIDDAGATYIPTADITLYAQWTPYYTITFNANGGTGTMNPIQVGMTEEIGIPACGFTKPASFTISFDANGGETVNPIVCSDLTYTGWEDHGDIIINDTLRSYTDYDAPYYGTRYVDVLHLLGGWVYNKVEIGNHAYGNGATEHRARTNYPRGTYAVRELSWSNDEGTHTGTVSKLSRLSTTPGAEVPLYAQWLGSITLPTPTLDGSRFLGWYIGDEKIGMGGETYAVTQSVTMQARWIPSYTVHFDGNNANGGAGVEDQVFAFDEAYQLPAEGFTREHTITYTGSGTWTEQTDHITAEFLGWEDCAKYKHTNSDGSTLIFCAVPGEGVDSLFDAPRYGTNSADVRQHPQFGTNIYDKDLLFNHYLGSGKTEYWVNHAASRCPYVENDPGYYPILSYNRYGSAEPYEYKSEPTLVRNLTNISGHTVVLKAHWDMPKVTLPVATRTGYTFVGWSDGSQTYAGTYTPDTDAKNIQLTSVWTANTYTVVFNGNGNTSGSMENQGFTYDQAQNLTANGFKKEYTITYNANSGSVTQTSETSTASFQGWATSAGGAKVYNDQQSVSNLTSEQGATVNLYAVWSNIPSVTLPTPTKTGYTFQGWYTEATGGTKIGDAGATYTPTEDITLHAQWTVNSYTVTLNDNGGEGGSTSVTATFGAAMPADATAPIRTGYTFAGYYDDATAGTQYYTATMTSAKNWDKASNTTLYAHWTANTYTVKLYPNGGTIGGSGSQDITVAYGQPMPEVVEETKLAGSIFAGYCDHDGKQYYDAQMNSVHDWDKTEGVTLYAMWENHQLNYNLNYDDAQTNLFTGWKGTVNKYGINFMYDEATGLITLKGTQNGSINAPIAQELPDVNVGDVISFRVTDYNGTRGNGWPVFETCDVEGKQPPSSLGRQAINIENNNSYKPNQTIRSGYDYMMLWVYNNDKNTPLDLDLSFRLRVEKSEALASVASPSGKYITRGDKYGTLVTPERDGYTFLGWFTEQENGTQINETDVFNGMGNIVAYAHWELTKTYTISFDAQGGSVCESKDVIYHRNYNTLPTTTRLGYVFDGWYTEITGGVQIFADTPVPYLGENGATQTVYAHWTPVTISGATPQTVDFTAQTETKTATLIFATANASSQEDFNEPTFDGADNGWTITDWDYANNQVAVTVSYTATENTTTLGDHVATVTLTAKSGNSATGIVTAHVEMTPVYTNTIAAAYKVDDEVDLNALWTSSGNGAKTYTIAHWTPLKEGESGATEPAIVGNKLSLGQAGTLTLKLIQEAGTSSKATEVTHTLTISKYTPAMSWVEGGTYYTNTTYAADAFYTITTGEVPLFQITGSSDQEVAREQDDHVHVRFFNKISATTITVTSVETYKWESVTWTQSFTPVANPNQAAFNYTSDFYNFEAITPSAGKIETTEWLFDGYQSDKLGRLRLTPNASSGDHARASVTFSFGGSASKYEFEYRHNDPSGVFAVYAGNNGLGEKPVWKPSSSEKPTSWTPQTVNFSTTTNTIQMAYANSTYSGEWALMKVYGDAYIFVTDKTQLDYPVLPLNQSETQTVRLAHANVGYVTTVSSDKEQFYVSLDGNNFAQSVTLSDYDHAVTGGGLQGVVPIYIRYRASVEGEYSGTVTIQDKAGHSQSISVHGETESELSTTMIWNTKTEFTGADTVVVNPFTVTDANGHELSVPIEITSSNPDIMYVRSNGTLAAFCGGSVTITGIYDGGSGYKPCQLSQVVNVERCYQYIDWNQTFMDLTTDGSGQIDKTILLTAKAMDGRTTAATNAKITYSISEDANHIASIIDYGNGTYSLRITGVGTAKITASAEQTGTFEAEEEVREIRVRRQGEPCLSVALNESGRQTIDWFNDGNTYHYTVPGETLQFWTNKLLFITLDADITVYGSPDGKSWSVIDTYNLSSTSKTKIEYPIDESYRYLKWTSGAQIENGSRYISDVIVTQKSYLRSSVTEISKNNVDVNEPFAATITISYSDVPVVNYSVTNNSGANLSLTPAQPINNDCGMVGIYTFTLAGKWSSGATYNETITFSTTDGKSINIPVHLEVKAGALFKFNVGNGNWNDPTKWSVSGSTAHGQIPGPSNAVEILNTVTVTEPSSCFEIRMDGDNAKLIIAPTGGLDIYNGGQRDMSMDNVVIQSSKSNQGYLRISPDAVNPTAISQPCPIPTATVEYASKGDLSTGANKDATWQYFGSPVEATNFTVDYVTWLYEWSEAQGWVDLKNISQPVALKPFQGYAITQYGTPTYSFAGQLIMHDTTVVLTHGGAMQGDNMIANSYPSPIDVKRFTADDIEGAVTKTFYVFNSGSWNQWNQETKEGTHLGGDAPGSFTEIPVLAAGETGEQTLIAPLQGICVHADPSDKEAKIHFNYRKHVWDALPSAKSAMNDGLHAPIRMLNESGTMDSASFVALQKQFTYQDSIARADEQRIKDLSHRVRITVSSDNSGSDHIVLLEKPQYTAYYDDGYDAPVMLNEGLLSLYTNEMDGQMAVSATNNLDSLYIGLIAGEDTRYQLHVSDILGEPLYLMDMMTEEVLKIDQDTTISFTAVANSQNDMRFRILKKDNTGQDIPTSWDALGANTKIWFDGENIHITDAPRNTPALLYSPSGQLLSSYPLTTSATSIQLPSLTQGVYLFKIGNKVMRFTKE